MAEHHEEEAREGDGLEAARQQFEQQRMTRRKALRRIGLGAGTIFMGVLSLDDLARLSAQKLQEHQATKGIGEQLAHEFKDAGVAFAGPGPTTIPSQTPGGPENEVHDCRGEHPGDPDECTACCGAYLSDEQTACGNDLICRDAAKARADLCARHCRGN